MKIHFGKKKIEKNVVDKVDVVEKKNNENYGKNVVKDDYRNIVQKIDNIKNVPVVKNVEVKTDTIPVGNDDIFQISEKNSNVSNVSNVDFDFSDVFKVDDSNDSLGNDLQEISRELTKDSNVFRFGNSNKLTVGLDSLLGAIGDKPYYNKNVRPRYEFIRHFRYHFAINNASIRSGQAERFKSIASSLLGFKAMLEYRSAGFQYNDDAEKKHSVLDKIKK